MPRKPPPRHHKPTSPAPSGTGEVGSAALTKDHANANAPQNIPEGELKQAPQAANARSAWDEIVGQFAALPEPVPPPDRPLRHRQQEAVIAFYRALRRGVRAQLIVLPTGGGKTILARDLIARHQRAIFHVPRRELLKQTVEVMRKAFGEDGVGSISDSSHNVQPHHRVVVAMVPTVYERLKFPEGHSRHVPQEGFDLVVFDECHHITARTWREVANHYRAPVLLGLTGTPERSDGAPLSDMFDEIVYELGIVDAVREGLLVPPLAKVVRTSVDISDVKRRGAELDATELARTIDTPARNRLIGKKYGELAVMPEGAAGSLNGMRRFIAFCASVEHAQHLAEEMSNLGYPTEAVWGSDPERETKLEAHASGKILGLTNVHTLTEGYDDPSISCVIMARPMGSRNTYTQALGRGLRLFPGKADCLVIDVVDNAGRHDLAAAWKFFGDNLAVQDERGRKRSPQSDAAAVDLYHALGGELDMSGFVRHVTLLRLPPEVRPAPYGTQLWHRQKATEQQKELLRRAGYDIDSTPWTAGQARVIIESFPPTARQAMLLIAHGYDVFYAPWTRLQADIALTKARDEGIKPNWERLKTLIPSYRDIMAKDQAEA